MDGFRQFLSETKSFGAFSLAYSFIVMANRLYTAMQQYLAYIKKLLLAGCSVCI